jgi:tetratricopeptide (TPR) repeat protein
VFFALGLLSKPMLVTLPFVMLLLDFWPLRRFEIKNGKPPIKGLLMLILEKSPFFLLVIGSCVVTFLAQQRGGAVASLQLFSFEARLANALAAYGGYLQKLVWPAKLAVLYLPPAQWPAWRLALAAFALVGITTLAIWQSRQRPYLIVGWLWFLGTLIPVIGLVQVGSQYMADRYSYVAFIGCFICLAWGGWDLANSKLGLKKAPSAPISPVTPGQGEGPASNKGEEKSSTIEEVLCVSSRRVFKRRVLWTGSLLLIAVAALLTHYQLEYWRTSESLFRHCLAVTTDNYIAYNNVGAILVNQRRYEEAKPFYTEALRINPAFIDAVMNMGTLLAIQGDVTNAVSYLEQGVHLAPGSAECYCKLAVALSEQGRLQEAVSCYRESVRLKPDQVPARNNLAWILATSPDAELRNGAEAVNLAERACELTRYQEPMLVGTLAAAYAEAGRFTDARNMAEKAVRISTAAGQTELAHKNEELKELYNAGKAYREQPKPTNQARSENGLSH